MCKYHFSGFVSAVPAKSLDRNTFFTYYQSERQLLLPTALSANSRHASSTCLWYLGVKELYFSSNSSSSIVSILQHSSTTKFSISYLSSSLPPPHIVSFSSLYHDSHFVLDDFFEIYRDCHSPLAMNMLRLLPLANTHYITSSLKKPLHT